MLADRAFVGKVLLGEGLVDDNNLTVFGHILTIEDAPDQERNPHSSEIITIDDAEVFVRIVIRVRGRMLGDGEKRVVAVTAQRQLRDESGSRSAGRRLDTFLEFAEK